MNDNNAAQPAQQDPIYDAIFILTEEADSLSECHTLKPGDWAGEPEAKARYDHIMAVVGALSNLRAEGVPVAGDPLAVEEAFQAWADRFPEISDMSRLRDAWNAAPVASAPADDRADAQEYGSPADVARRIEQYLAQDGRMNSGTQLLYEAMKALRSLARGSK